MVADGDSVGVNDGCSEGPVVGLVLGSGVGIWDGLGEGGAVGPSVGC